MTTRRFLGGEIREAVSEDGHHYVELRAIQPGVVDDYGTLWNAAAFDESLGRRLPVLAWSHDWADPIGCGVSYTADDGGPMIRFRFDDFDAVPRARQAFAQVQSGTLRDCSVGFSRAQRRDPNDDERAAHPTAREVIDAADLDEVSIVLRGAVPGAEILSVRMLEESRGPVDREAAAKIILRVATGEVDVKEALTQLEALEVSEDGGDPDDETPPDPDAPDESGQESEDDTPDPAEVAAILDDVDAEIDAALSLIDV